MDYDNDVLLDLVASTPSGLTVARDVGPSWADVTSAAVTLPQGTVPSTRGLAAADIEEEAEGKSMMPTGLTKFLTKGELLYLIRFISELGRPGRTRCRRCRQSSAGACC